MPQWWQRVAKPPDRKGQPLLRSIEDEDEDEVHCWFMHTLESIAPRVFLSFTPPPQYYYTTAAAAAAGGNTYKLDPKQHKRLKPSNNSSSSWVVETTVYVLLVGKVEWVITSNPVNHNKAKIFLNLITASTQ